LTNARRKGTAAIGRTWRTGLRMREETTKTRNAAACASRASARSIAIQAGSRSPHRIAISIHSTTPRRDTK
jgi:hypothetical protein